MMRSSPITRCSCKARDSISELWRDIAISVDDLILGQLNDAFRTRSAATPLECGMNYLTAVFIRKSSRSC
jgi:hypothetical protein